MPRHRPPGEPPSPQAPSDRAAPLAHRGELLHRPAAPVRRTGGPATSTASWSPAPRPAARTSRWRRSCRPAAVRRRTSTATRTRPSTSSKATCEFLLGDRIVIATRGRLRQRPARRGPPVPQRRLGPGPPDPHLHPSGHREVLRRDARARERPRPLPPDNVDEVAARYAEAAPRYGIEFLTSARSPSTTGIRLSSCSSGSGAESSVR